MMLNCLFRGRFFFFKLKISDLIRYFGHTLFELLASNIGVSPVAKLGDIRNHGLVNSRGTAIRVHTRIQRLVIVEPDSLCFGT